MTGQADVLMRRYEKASTIITANRGLEDWATPLGDVVVGPLLDRLMHHGHLLKLDRKSWRLKGAAARVAEHATANQSPVRPVAQVGEFAVAIGNP